MDDRESSRERERSPRRGSARAKLLAAASARFYEQGVAGTGIDVITTDAGVAKMSLYNNFASKTDLVAVYLEQRQQEFRDLQRQRAEALPAGAGTGPRAVTIFDAYIDHAEATTGFRGCGLLNVAGELPTGDPNRQRVARHKAEVEQLFRDALSPRDNDPPCHVADVDALAEHLAALLEGAAVRAGLDGDVARLHRARTIASDLINASTSARRES